MKNIFILFIVTIFALAMFSGCGEDGQPGKAYLAFEWDWYVYAYDDNNSDTPYTIYQNTNYETSPGTYSYEYWCSDGVNFWSFYGTYTIEVNPGEEASWFADGDDGANLYYTFVLSGSGPWMYKPTENESNKPVKEYLDSEHNDSAFNKVNVGEMETITVKYPYGKLIVTKQAVQWIKK